MSDQMFFNGWEPLIRTVVVGVLAYATLVTMLRLSGKRTLAKLNAFDLIVTVALGSTLASILTSSDVALAQGILAFFVLIGLQFLLAHLASRPHPIGRQVQGLIKSEPTLLLFRGEMLAEAIRGERLTELEVLAAIRSQGHAEVSGLEAVVLETDGTISVMASPRSGASSALQPVRGYHRG